MRKNVKNIILVLVIVTLLLGLLGGCCCYCPTCPPIQEWAPLITLEKTYCDFYDDLRIVTPWSLRDITKPDIDLASKEDTQKAIYNVCGIGGNFVTNFLSQLGCEQLPLIIAEHLDGTKEYLTAVSDNGKDVVFYRVSYPSGDLEEEELEPDYSIVNVIVR